MDRRILLAGSMSLIAIPATGFAKSRKNSRKKKKNKNKTNKKKPGNLKYRSASSVAQVDSILGPLAEKIEHGDVHEGLSLDELEALMAQGVRLIVLCGNQSSLAIRALNRAGIDARLINPLTNEPWQDNAAFGHTSMEVRVEDRWQVFDMTGNAQLVDSQGVGMDVSTACQTRPLLYRSFAFDPINSSPNALDDLQAYYEFVFQIPIIRSDDLWWRFHDAANRDRIQSIDHSWHWATGKEWEQLQR